MGPTVAVLLYHSISDAPPVGHEAWTVSPSQFSEQVRALVDSGASPISLERFLEHLRTGAALPPQPYLVTFDDGFADQLDAASLLAAQHIPSAVYVTAGFVDREGYLESSQVADLAQVPGVVVGAHSVSHLHLDAVRPDVLASEVATSRATLEALAGRAVRDFAYPHGSHSRREREHLASQGWRSAAAVKNALSHRDDLAFGFARVTVLPGSPPSAVADLVAGRGAPVAWRRERARTMAARQARRLSAARSRRS